ncbi:hypothetical protein CEXT_309401 [Caerostris extrusa]|uniref:Uncharacterized protein n=1 Tax=Caerostris extrusa TaxID=172846 RepID=A0AAV4NZN9_CAEEX|nr:hypothetical protein CEXT_309401 [Caerostris extrusa]
MQDRGGSNKSEGTPEEEVTLRRRSLLSGAWKPNRWWSRPDAFLWWRRRTWAALRLQRQQNTRNNKQ